MFFFWFCFVWSKGAKDGEFIDIYWTLSKNVDYFRHQKNVALKLIENVGMDVVGLK